MTKIAYVGQKKDGERAFKERTNIEWFPGSVEEVDAKVAAEMLKHPDVFAAADAGAELSTAKPAAATPENNPGIPSWAKAGIEAGLTDEQLESLAQVGGPDTETGAKLWLDLVGKPYHTEPAAPTYVMRMPDGIPRVLDDMKLDALKDLAAALRVRVNSNALEKGYRNALIKAYPLKK